MAISRSPHIIGPVHSNANGSYIRLDNGWQVAWGVTDSHAVSTAVGSGGMLRTGTESHVFPAPFLPGEVVISASPEMTGGNPSGHYVAPSSTGTGFNFRIYAPTSAEARIAFIAVGKWN